MKWCSVFSALLVFTLAPPVEQSYTTWLPIVSCQISPYVEKRKPTPHDVDAATIVLQPSDLPTYILDTRSGDVLPHLVDLGAVSAQTAIFWAPDLQTTPLLVHNLGVVFWTNESAQAYLVYLANRCVDTGGTVLRGPEFADGTVVCRHDTGYLINFRYGNVVSGVGTDSTLKVATAHVQLALTRVVSATR